LGKHSPEKGHVDNTAPGGSEADQKASEQFARIKRDSFSVPPTSIERGPERYKNSWDVRPTGRLHHSATCIEAPDRPQPRQGVEPR
jgi:hypothetical protein